MVGWQTSIFQVTRARAEDFLPVGEYAVTGNNLPQGLGMQVFRDVDADDDPKCADVATTGSGLPWLGLLTQDVETDGVSLEDVTIGRQRLPAKSGERVTIVRPRAGVQVEIECLPSIAVGTAQPTDQTNGYLLVTSGTGDVTNAKFGTKLSYQSGRLRVAQTGDLIVATVVRKMTPRTTGNIRLEIEFCDNETSA